MRFMFPLPEAADFNRIHYSPLDISCAPGEITHLSNASFLWISEPDSHQNTIDLNIYGFRDRDWPLRSKAGHRVAFIGDSFVEGFMAEDSESIPAVFGSLARDSGLSVETMNLGIGGAGIEHISALVRDIVPLFRPTSMVFVLYANDVVAMNGHMDFSRLPDKRSRRLIFVLPRLLWIADRLIKCEPVPRAWRARPMPFVRAVPHPSNPWSAPENERAFSGFVDPGIADAMRRGAFNPHIINEYGLYERILKVPAEPLPLLAGMKSYLDAFGVKLSIVYLPSRSQVSDAYLPFQAAYSVDKQPHSLMGPQYNSNATELARVCSMLNIPFLDLTPALGKREQKGERLFWSFDEHMRPAGYRLAAERTFEFWRDAIGNAPQSRQ